MIDSNKYNRTIQLHCPTCGGTDFSPVSQATGGDTAPIKCSSCGLTTTRSELIAANGENIAAHVDEIKREVRDDITKSLKNAFKGNKFFKIK